LGGGVIFGPQPRSYAKKVNKKIAALALKRAFSERIVEGDIVIVDKFDLVDHKTKNAKAILDALKVNERSVLLSVAEFDECTVCATGNLPNVALRKSQSVNVYELLRFNKLVFTKEGLDLFIERLG
jgi:large subunit ribosomal protein L4